MAKKKAGRPAHSPTDATRAIVEMLVAAGLSQEEIAKKLKIAENTLAKHYRHELDVGWINGVADAATVVFKQIKEGDADASMKAAMYFLNRRGKGLWSEQKQMEITGAKGGPVQIAPANIQALDYDEREALESMLATVLSLPPPTTIDHDDDVEQEDDA